MTPLPQAAAIDPMLLCPWCLTTGSGGVCARCGFEDGAAEIPLDALPPRAILCGRYFVGLPLGRGGFGITYRGLDMATGAKVAIKEFMPTSLVGRSRSSQQVVPHSSKEAQYFQHGLMRFEEEARALAALDHPGIVKILDYFEANRTGYLVMPYLEGLTLARFIEHKGGKIPFAAALEIMMRVMDSLRQLHIRGLLHRDISPDNIYITFEKHVILLDFGAARSVVSDSTRTVLFKPGFAPIEMYVGRNQGPFTDVYAVAATLYAACTGLIPTPAPERTATRLTPPRELGVEMSSASERAVIRGMAIDATDRFASIEQFQAALQASVSDSWNQSTRVAVIVGGVLAVVLIAMLLAQL